LVDIMEGRILVTGHSYRSDEILMLMRVAERFGFRINSFTHVLEGYKVADELAAHGAAAGTFSDWWMYKLEAYDAIPYNAAIMHEPGVKTAINSDIPWLQTHKALAAVPQPPLRPGIYRKAGRPPEWRSPRVSLGVGSQRYAGGLETLSPRRFHRFRLGDQAPELFGRFENGHRTRRNFHGIAGARITRHPGLTASDLERAESPDLDVALIGQSLLDRVEERVHDPCTVLLRYHRPGCSRYRRRDLLDQIRLGH